MNIYCRHCGECHPKYACKKSVSILSTQCDILSTPAEIKSDDAEVAALMMEADIEAPIKEQCEENARLMLEIASIKHDLIVAKHDLVMANMKVEDLTAKVKRYQDAAISLIELAGDVRA